MRPKLVVLGNPRSGTCLLSFLLATGFDLRSRFDGHWPPSRSIFMYRAHPSVALEHADSSYHCLFITRDPRDVTTSVHPSHRETGQYLRTLDEWIESYEMCDELEKRGVPVFRFKYEDLIADPSAMQQKIAEFLGLEVACPFEDCHNNFMSIDFEDLEQLSFEMGGVSPLLTTRIGRWKNEEHRDRIQEQLAATPEIIGWLIKLGYEKDDSWTKDYIRSE